MITTILLVIFTLSLIVFLRTKDDWDANSTNFAALIVCTLSLIALVMAFVFLMFKGYNYNEFKSRKQAIEQTIRYSRQHGSEIERAAIIQKMTVINEVLAHMKYQNSIFLMDEFIDDRIDTMQFIK